jgi:two-component system LytT family response regulator
MSMHTAADTTTDSSIRVVIADDEPLARQLLTRLVESQPDLLTVGVAETGESAWQLIRKTRPDLVFLDIKMPEMNGVELAAALRAHGNSPYVVFVTGYNQFATRAFDLDALDYLVKPIAKDRFRQSVERARKAICADRLQELGEKIAAVTGHEASGFVAAAHDARLTLRQGDELLRIDERDVYWLEAASQYVRVHTASHSYVVAESLNRFLQKLSPQLFKRVHRSAAVNVSKVDRVLRCANGVHELRLCDGTAVPLSRSRRRQVSAFLDASARNREHIGQ